ncbi:MAG: S-layer homology domain-containing protein [Clostridia bacterium]|nr:S-layer homology domain-containing protein [Clostridia bacterium]
MSAFKKLAVLVLAMVMATVCVCPVFAEDSIFDTSATGSGIKDTDGYITVKGSLSLDGGIPVTIIVATRILDGEEDVTATQIKNNFLNVVEYTRTITLPDSGNIDLAFYVNDSMDTGWANVYVSYNGGEELELIGEFEHVGREDINNLLAKFNNYEASTYPGTILTDMEGENTEDDIKGDEILKKIGADIDAYTAITAKTDFATILHGYKPAEGGFTAPVLIEKFNEAVAWMELRESSDTLSVLSKYNEVYWNVDIEEDSDFDSLSEEAKAEILSYVKTGGFVAAQALEDGFEEKVVLAIFKAATDRNVLEELFANAAYAEYFETVNELIADANLKGKKQINMMNYIVDNRETATTIEKLEELVEKAIKKYSGDDGGGGSPSRPSPSPDNDKTTSNIVVKVPSAEVSQPDEPSLPEAPKHPFKDVPAGHWAESYIVQMYNEGIINGKSSESFAPSDKINRQDFVKMIVEALDIAKVSEESTFDDVEKGSFYETYIMSAVNAGIINGVSDTTFGMASVIKRQDVAVILSRAIAEKLGENAGAGKSFADDGEIPEYAKEAVEMVSSCGLFVGDDAGKFNPANGLSRAEAAALISRLLAFINE